MVAPQLPVAAVDPIERAIARVSKLVEGSVEWSAIASDCDGDLGEMLFSTLRQIRDPGTAMAPGNTTAETAIQNSIMAHRTVLDKLTRARELLLFVRFEVEWRYLAEKARIQFGDEPPA